MNDLHKRKMSELLFEEIKTFDVENTKNIPKTKLDNSASPRIGTAISRVFESNGKPKNWDNAKSNKEKEKLIFRYKTNPLGPITAKNMIVQAFCKKPIMGIKLDPYNIKDQHEGVDAEDFKRFMQRQVMFFVLKDNNDKIIGAESNSGVKSFYVIAIPPLYTEIELKNNFSTHKALFGIKGNPPENAVVWYENVEKVPVIQISTEEQYNHDDLLDKFLKSGTFTSLQQISRSQQKIKGTKLSNNSEEKKGTNENVFLNKNLSKLLFENESDEVDISLLDSEFVDVKYSSKEDTDDDADYELKKDSLVDVDLDIKDVMTILQNTTAIDIKNDDQHKSYLNDNNIKEFITLQFSGGPVITTYKRNDKFFLLISFSGQSKIVPFTKELGNEFISDAVLLIDQMSEKEQNVHITEFNELFGSDSYAKALKTFKPEDFEDYAKDKKYNVTKDIVNIIENETVQIKHDESFVVSDSNGEMLTVKLSDNGKNIASVVGDDYIFQQYKDIEDSVTDRPGYFEISKKRYDQNAVMKSFINKLVKFEFEFDHQSGKDTNFKDFYKTEQQRVNALISLVQKKYGNYTSAVISKYFKDKGIEAKNTLTSKYELKQDIENRTKVISAIPANVYKDLMNIYAPLSKVGLNISEEDVKNKSLEKFINDQITKMKSDDFLQLVIDEIDQKDILSAIKDNLPEQEFSSLINLNLVNKIEDIDLNEFYKLFQKRVVSSLGNRGNINIGSLGLKSDFFKDAVTHAYYEFTGFNAKEIQEDNYKIKGNLLTEAGIGSLWGSYKGVMIGKAAAGLVTAVLGIGGLSAFGIVIGGVIAGYKIGEYFGNKLDQIGFIDKFNAKLAGAYASEKNITIALEDEELADGIKSAVRSILEQQIKEASKQYFASISDILSDVNITVGELDSNSRFKALGKRYIEKVKNKIAEEEKFENLTDEAENFLQLIYELPMKVSKEMGPLYNDKITSTLSKQIIDKLIREVPTINGIFTKISEDNKLSQEDIQDAYEPFIYKKGLKMLLEAEADVKGFRNKRKKKLEKIYPNELYKEIYGEVTKIVESTINLKPDGYKEFIKYAKKKNYIENVEGLKESLHLKDNILNEKFMDKVKTAATFVADAWKGKPYIKVNNMILTLSHITGIPFDKVKKAVNVPGLDESVNKSNNLLIESNTSYEDIVRSIKRLGLSEYQEGEITKRLESIEKANTKIAEYLQQPHGEVTNAVDIENNRQAILRWENEIRAFEDNNIVVLKGKEILSDLESYFKGVQDAIGDLTDQVSGSILPDSVADITLGGTLTSLISIGFWGFKAWNIANKVEKENILIPDIEDAINNESNNLFSAGLAAPITYSIVKVLTEDCKEYLKSLGYEVRGTLDKDTSNAQNLEDDAYGNVSPLFSKEAHSKAKESLLQDNDSTLLKRIFKGKKITDEQISEQMEKEFKDTLKDVLMSLTFTYSPSTAQAVQERIAIDIQRSRSKSSNRNAIASKAGGVTGKILGGGVAGLYAYGAIAGLTLATGGLPLALIAAGLGGYAGGKLTGWVGSQSLEYVSESYGEKKEEQLYSNDSIFEKDDNFKRDLKEITSILKSLAKKIKKLEENKKLIYKNKIHKFLFENKSDNVLTKETLTKKLKGSNVSIYRILGSGDQNYKNAEDDLVGAISGIMSNYFGIKIPEAKDVSVQELRAESKITLTTNKQAKPGEVANINAEASVVGTPTPSKSTDPVTLEGLVAIMSRAGGDNLSQFMHALATNPELINKLADLLKNGDGTVSQASEVLQSDDKTDFNDLDAAIEIAIKSFEKDKTKISKKDVQKLYYTFYKTEAFSQLIKTKPFKIKTKTNEYELKIDDTYKDQSSFILCVKGYLNIVKDEDIDYNDNDLETIAKNVVSKLFKNKGKQLKTFKELMKAITSKIIKDSFDKYEDNDDLNSAIDNIKVLEEVKKLKRQKYISGKISNYLFERKDEYNLNKEWLKVWGINK